MNGDAISKFKPYTRQSIRQAPEWEKLTAE
jgi:hypothetical protein